MAQNGQLSVRLELTSAFEMVDLVQLVADHVGREIGFDDEDIHWVGVAIRECVINAIKHGNQSDSSKRVFVDLITVARAGGTELKISVRDQGEGFDPEALTSPLEPENLLKASGRGIFLIRNFMDDVQLQQTPDGGMEICMTKRVPSGATGNQVKA
jgi:serine/threonine-protein kinase RsbW